MSPGPHLVGCPGHHLGLRMVRVAALGPALPDRLVPGQDPVHRPLRAQVDALVQQRRVHFRGSAVREARRTQHLEDLAVLRFAQGPGRSRPGLPLPGLRPPATVERGVRDPQGRARRAHAHVPGQAFGRAQELFPVPEAQPQQPRYFSLDLDHDARLAEFLAQPRVLPLERPHPPRLPLPARGPRSALLRQLSQRPLPRRLPPPRQMRAVQPLAPKQLADLTRRLAPIRLLDDRQLVRRGEAPPRRLRRHLRIRRGCRASLALPRREGHSVRVHSFSSSHPSTLCLALL